MNESEGLLSPELPKEIHNIDSKSLTIKITSSGKNLCKKNIPNNMPSTPDSVSKNSLANSVASSPPSSAFVSALQSSYVSPRFTVVENPNPTQKSPTAATTITHPSPPVSYCGSQSDDIPSTSYTPPPERYEYSDDPTNTKLNSAPRISFSFLVPRISFAKGSISPASNAKLRSCDVYIGFNGQNPNLIRFCKWLKPKLEVQGIACFVADRAKYADNQSHDIADMVICSVTYGIVVVTSYTVLNHLSLEEIRFFAQKKNLIPLFFDTDANEIAAMFTPHSDNKECKEALDKLMKYHEFKLEANDGNLRNCVSKAARILRAKLGRKSVTEKEVDTLAEFSLPRNKYFVEREKEIVEIETAFFGCGDCLEQESVMPAIKGGTPGQSGGLADEESEVDTVK